MTEATNEAMEYKTLYTRTEIHYDEHGVPFDVLRLNRGMSVHGHHCQTKDEFYKEISKLCFVEYVMRTDPMNWLIVCKGKWNKEEPFFTAYWEPDCSKHSEDAFCITEFMTEGIPERRACQVAIVWTLTDELELQRSIEEVVSSIFE